MGVEYIESGEIIQIYARVQPNLKNVPPGWKIIKINEKPYSKEVLRQKSMNSKKNYDLTLQPLVRKFFSFSSWLFFIQH